MIAVMKRAVSVFVLLLASTFAHFAYAQTTPINADFISGYGLRNLETAIIIRADPPSPGPGEAVHLTVESPVYDLLHDNVSWTINGRAAAEGIGVTATDYVMNAKGDSLHVSVNVSDPVWGAAAQEVEIVPLQLDLLFDAPSYVPPFYRGRAMPSSGGTVRLQAVAHFKKDGAFVADKDITYIWKRNGQALGTISGLGRSSAVIDAPLPGDTDTITVRADAANGTLSATASVAIPSGEVALALYEDHPLFGVMFHQMLPERINLPSGTVVSAIPYFATITSLLDPTLRFNWTLNQSSVQASSTRRNEITLISNTDNANLHLDLTHAVNFFLRAEGDWLFNLSGSRTGPGAAGVQNNDAFHNGQI